MLSHGHSTSVAWHASAVPSPRPTLQQAAVSAYTTLPAHNNTSVQTQFTLPTFSKNAARAIVLQRNSLTGLEGSPTLRYRGPEDINCAGLILGVNTGC